MAGVNQERRGPLVLLLMLAIVLLLEGYLIWLWGWGMVIPLTLAGIFALVISLLPLYWDNLKRVVLRKK